jgi:hypothetical protein
MIIGIRNVSLPSEGRDTGTWWFAKYVRHMSQDYLKGTTTAFF